MKQNCVLSSQYIPHKNIRKGTHHTNYFSPLWYKSIFSPLYYIYSREVYFKRIWITGGWGVSSPTWLLCDIRGSSEKLSIIVSDFMYSQVSGILLINYWTTENTTEKYMKFTINISILLMTICTIFSEGITAGQTLHLQTTF